MGAPSVYFVYGMPQDGITAPADFNATASSYLRSLWNGTATGTQVGTLTFDAATGFYTATLTGVTIPDTAVMLTGGLGYSYNVSTALPLTQTNLASYPTAASTVAGQTNKTGGLIVVSPNVQKVATGYTGRRVVVSDALCNKCHQELGAFTEEAFHGGQRNDGTTCSWCHTPNRTSSGWSADSTSFIHAIHGGAKREVPFTWHASSTTESFADIQFPGILRKCETCHLPGTYDFSAAASASALPNRLYKTVATGLFNGTAGTLTTGCTVTAINNCLQTEVGAYSLSPYVIKDNATSYGSGFSVSAGVPTDAAGTTLVNSPITTQCFSCHDSVLARAHMEVNGGSIYVPRSTALGTIETCQVCHDDGRIADIEVMHAK
jgi:OmcA/MtrC family decaheme c-type cytochrome